MQNFDEFAAQAFPFKFPRASLDNGKISESIQAPVSFLSLLISHRVLVYYKHITFLLSITFAPLEDSLRANYISNLILNQISSWIFSNKSFTLEGLC